MVSLKYLVAVCESVTVDILPAHMPLGAICHQLRRQKCSHFFQRQGKFHSFSVLRL